MRFLPDVCGQVDLNLTLLPQGDKVLPSVFFPLALGSRNVTNDSNFSWDYEIGVEER